MTRQDSLYLSYLEREAALLRRLAAVELAYPGPDRARAERALDTYFRNLGVAPRQVRWAADALEGYSLASEPEIVAARGELSKALTGAAAGSLGHTEHGWKAAWDAARATHLLWVKRLLGAAHTGDTDPRWSAVRDALDNAVRATAVCGSIRRQSVTAFLYERDYDSVWLPFVEAHEAGLWLFWVHRHEVIAVPRPSLHMKGELFHRDGGPAVDWPGGEGFYFLNGVKVTKEIAETPAGLLDPHLVVAEWNAEVRREIVRKIGIERVCAGLGAECVDREGDYELLMLDLKDGWHKRPYLKMRNPSIGVFHIEGVPPHCRTVRDALAWRNGTDVPPSVLT